ncbi:amidohydrolase family protein [Subtercola sp. YIM 133946]|uniref:amidohydrolase family protein n=1 Tax=Subtercola sp. YIM 133946 TaxID=3118909 RepID=UPI002F921F09
MTGVYESGIDLAAVVAIDTHVHIEVGDDGRTALPPDLAEAASTYFKTGGTVPTLDAIADFYRERQMAAVVFTVDAEFALGTPPISSIEVVEGAARNSDVLIPFASVDPHRADAADLARVLVSEHGARGFKFHPTVQGFDPSDEQWFGLWQVIDELGVPALFHTGQTGIGAGTPGGHGLRLGLSNPILLDEVAAAFPSLTIVMAHPSVPWQDEAISVATHKSNVYIDLSGWRPKYFPPQLVRAANSFLQDRVLFGSDFPLISPDVWMTDFADLGLKDTVRPKILKANAVTLLGLA